MTYLFYRDTEHNCWAVAHVSPSGQSEVIESYPHARQARARAQVLRAALSTEKGTPTEAPTP
jgi:hypothetical protein